MIEAPTVEGFQTMGGPASMVVRPETSDHNTLFSCMAEDEYDLRSLPSEGVAVDIGAHIGGVTVSLALMGWHVVAVEALSENVTLLRDNVERNGVSERVAVLHAAAGAKGKTTRVEWDFTASDSGKHHRYIGNAQQKGFKGGQHEQVSTISVGAIIDLAGGHVDFMKIDCEGCEYGVLASPDIRSIPLIRGEHHAGIRRIEEALFLSHVVTLKSGTEAFGTFEARHP
jgi:FkbM family methyltransferase